MPKLSTGLVVALLGGALLLGCGSSSKSKSSTNPAATSAAREVSPQQRVEACKRIALAPSALAASTKAKLLKSCERVGTSTAAERQFVHEACEALAAQEPAGATRERALAICRRAP
jgi:hypothetical protein